jgi:hypothetical protein
MSLRHLTWGDALAALAALLLLVALVQAAAWLRNRGFGAGTPQYARARDGRRYALWALAAALLLFAAGCLTPLCRAPIA